MQPETENLSQTRSKSSLLSNIFITLLLIVGGIIAGYFHSITQPQQWKVTAKLAHPKITDLGNYFSLYSTYSIVQNDGKSDPNLEKNITEAVFNEFTKTITAEDNRQQFLKNHSIVKQIAEVHYKSTNEIALDLGENLLFDPNENTLSLVLVNPEQAVKLLNDFLSQSTNLARREINNDLIAKWKFLFQNVKQSADANLGESWKGKLNLMRSVQPLDNKLVPYNLVQKPTRQNKAELPKNLYLSLSIGGVLGLLLGLVFILLRRK